LKSSPALAVQLKSFPAQFLSAKCFSSEIRTETGTMKKTLFAHFCCCLFCWQVFQAEAKYLLVKLDDNGAEGQDLPVYDRDQPVFGQDQPVFRRDQPVEERDRPVFERESVFERDRPVFERDQPAFGQDQLVEERGRPVYERDQPVEERDQPVEERRDEPIFRKPRLSHVGSALEQGPPVLGPANPLSGWKPSGTDFMNLHFDQKLFFQTFFPPILDKSPSESNISLLRYKKQDIR
jgi:hypothetical protein